MTERFVCNVYKVCSGRSMITLSSFSISKPPPIKPPMPSLRPLLFLGLSALLSSTMAQMGLDDDGRGWDRTMGHDDPNNTKTMASGQNTNDHLLAKRATIECYPKCCKACATGKHKICGKKSMGMPPGCGNGKYCSKKCILVVVKKYTGK